MHGCSSKFVYSYATDSFFNSWPRPLVGSMHNNLFPAALFRISLPAGGVPKKRHIKYANHEGSFRPWRLNARESLGVEVRESSVGRSDIVATKGKASFAHGRESLSQYCSARTLLLVLLYDSKRRKGFTPPLPLCHSASVRPSGTAGTGETKTNPGSNHDHRSTRPLEQHRYVARFRSFPKKAWQTCKEIWKDLWVCTPFNTFFGPS